MNFIKPFVVSIPLIFYLYCMTRWIVIIITVFAFLQSCKEPPPDPCDRYNLITGAFSTFGMEGTMTFSGGIDGRIDIRGLDYNDMTCTYQILNCETGQADMNCDGAGINRVLKVISADSIQVSQIVYVRVK